MIFTDMDGNRFVYEVLSPKINEKMTLYIAEDVYSLYVDDSDVSFMGLFEGCENVEYLHIGSHFTGWIYDQTTDTYYDRQGDLSLHGFKNLKNVDIQQSNPCFFVLDGVVYCETDTVLMLMCYMNYKEGTEYITPATDKIFEIAPFAFSDTKCATICKHRFCIVIFK